jgi:hypothetical protein
MAEKTIVLAALAIALGSVAASASTNHDAAPENTVASEIATAISPTARDLLPRSASKIGEEFTAQRLEQPQQRFAAASVATRPQRSSRPRTPPINWGTGGWGRIRGGT